MIRHIVLFVLLSVSASLRAQQVISDTTFSGHPTDLELGMSVTELPNGNFAIGGHVLYSPNNLFPYAWLAHTDSMGHLLNWTSYSPTNSSKFDALERVSNGNYLVTDFSSLRMLDSVGNTQWLLPNFGQHVATIEPLPGDRFVVATQDQDSLFLNWIDTTGTVYRRRGYGDSLLLIGGYQHLLPNGDFMVNGSTLPTQDSMNAMFRIDSAGNVLWHRRDYGYPSGMYTSRYAGIPGSEEGYLGIEDRRAGPDSASIYLAKINGQGDTLWTTNFRHHARTQLYEMMATNDAGVVLLGNYRQTTQGPDFPFLVRFNCLGNIEWLMDFPGQNHRHVVGMCEAANDDIVVVGDRDWTDAAFLRVKGCPDLIPDFTSTVDTTTNTVTFYNLSIGTGTLTYHWDFGDGTTSTAQHPIHIYNTPPPFMVKLTVSDSCGVRCTWQNVDLCPAPEAICQNITVHLDSSGTAHLTGADLDGGSIDHCGIEYMMASPQVLTCADTGITSVQLIVMGMNGRSDTCTSLVTVVGSPPTAVCQNIPLLLDTNGTAVLTPSDLDGGSSDVCGIASMSASPQVFSCADVGTVPVLLTVTNTSGATDSCTATVTVGGAPSPTAAFGFNLNLWNATFSDQSSGNGIFSWNWDFGDGNTSTLMNPTHSYAMPGSYQVCLEVTDSCGQDSTCLPLVLVSTDPDVPSDVRIYPNPTTGWVEFDLGQLNDVSIKVFTPDGKVWLEEQVAGTPHHQVFLPGPAGVYFVEVSDTYGSIRKPVNRFLVVKR